MPIGAGSATSTCGCHTRVTASSGITGLDESSSSTSTNQHPVVQQTDASPVYMFPTVQGCTAGGLRACGRGQALPASPSSSASSDSPPGTLRPGAPSTETSFDHSTVPSSSLQVSITDLHRVSQSGQKSERNSYISIDSISQMACLWEDGTTAPANQKTSSNLISRRLTDLSRNVPYPRFGNDLLRPEMEHPLFLCFAPFPW